MLNMRNFSVFLYCIILSISDSETISSHISPSLTQVSGIDFQRRLKRDLPHGREAEMQQFSRQEGQNVTENPYFIDQKYFDKDKREFLLALGPHITHVSISSSVNVSFGRTARLKCFTYNVPNVSVSWIRHNDVNILSLNQLVYTKDQRVSVHVTGDMLEWELVIDDVTEEDAGQYECQVNTNPLSQLKAVLRVTKSFAHIQGDQELFMAEKSFLNLTCLIHTVDTPQGVFWRHQEKLLLTDYEEGVIVTDFTRLNSSLVSTSLSVWLTSPHQSGNYHCIPTNTQKATVKLHVLTGDMLRAMYSNSSRALHPISPLLLARIVVTMLLLRNLLTKGSS